MIKNYPQLLISKLHNPAEQLFIASAVVSPLFLLTISGWMTRIVAVCALLAMYVLYRNNKAKNHKLALNSKISFHTKLLCATLALPILAIFLGQLFRGQYTWSYYDSPAHILIGIFILLATAKAGVHVVKWMSYTFPIVTLLALANILIDPNLHWGATRLSTQAVDPLMFGSLSLTFGLLSLISIKLHDNDSKWLTVYKLIGFGSGIYLSIASGSRTGWLALPIIGFLWLYFDRAKFTLPIKIIGIISILTFITSAYFLSSNVQQRVDITAKEVLAYQWNTDAPNDNTSVGARISFIRMAVFLFQQKPLGGWGDGNFENVINDPALNFSSLEAKKIALEAGFHNDITANMVRSGIWGLMATVALFLIPALFFIRNMHSEYKNQRDVAFLALAFLTCQFVSSLSMEIFNLRYSASFFGLMLAVFCGQMLFYMSHNTTDFNGKYNEPT
ncbi:O-antigen ligase [Methylotenera sp.]|uniref:O-antigen ligase family protein n=1 Tax=Methylotenera sp. TaxID=2051956 RepID=UPI0027312859|nr:O-antigen ligase family protein [Methylotenera sp.]MDP2070953.1 O-antigen ligase family protein [Methylotenera sp.]MDP3005827.1 O-antigen ligase family protein [Methylotenera sp.]